MGMFYLCTVVCICCIFILYVMSLCMYRCLLGSILQTVLTRACMVCVFLSVFESLSGILLFWVTEMCIFITRFAVIIIFDLIGIHNSNQLCKIPL